MEMIDIKEKAQCCGCEACQQICPVNCISLHIDEEGFLYPKVDKSRCIECKLCERTCPIINKKDQEEILESYAAQSTNKDAIKLSSSGGIFPEIAKYVFSQGGIVYACYVNSENKIIHGCFTNNNDLWKAQGSKYVQSRIGNCFKEVKTRLNDGYIVLFVGTPCHISALKLFLRKDYENLITVDFICHGVPSPGVYNRYFNEVLIEQASDAVVSFRDKKYGWKKSGLSLWKPITGSSKRDYVFFEDKYNNAYIKAFLSDIIVRPSCFECPIRGKRHVSEITLGDLWGADKLTFENLKNDDSGISIVIVNKPKGLKLLNHLENIVTEQANLHTLLRQNPSYFKNTKKTARRAAFFKAYTKTNDISKILYKYSNPSTLESVRILIIKSLQATGLLKLFKHK